MSLQHILLGLLQQPASGYDLKQEFQQRLSHYWGAELAQIYPALKRMQRDGLLSSTLQPSDKGPRKRIYQRTAAGRKSLQQWLQSGPEVHTDRLSWLAQVAFLDTVAAPDQIEFLQQLRQAFIQHRAELQAIEDHWRAQDPACPDQLQGEDLFAHMTLRLGVAKYTTIINWCSECVQRLKPINDNQQASSDHSASS
jgi:PadR family transcriptional regulator, regulatory protein AphA